MNTILLIPPATILQTTSFIRSKISLLHEQNLDYATNPFIIRWTVQENFSVISRHFSGTRKDCHYVAFSYHLTSQLSFVKQAQH